MCIQSTQRLPSEEWGGEKGSAKPGGLALEVIGRKGKEAGVGSDGSEEGVRGNEGWRREEGRKKEGGGERSDGSEG